MAMLLKRLCEENGVSGNETAVRDIILSEIRDKADNIKIDAMGNIIAFKKGRSSDKTVMLAAHMDEVGFIISGITDKGYLEFKTVGGIDTRVLISKRVTVGASKIKGVIGMKAIHLQKKSERETVPAIRDIYIDIGASDKKTAEKLVKIGDYGTFDTQFSDFGADKIKSKAIDDRVGCEILVSAFDVPCEYDRYICFTVQEEVGLRGAQTAAYRIKPDIALVIEATTCSDVHGFEPHEYVTTVGGGAAVTFMDRTTIVNRRFSQWLMDEGQKSGIPVQYKRTAMGGNDAGAVHKAAEGVMTASVSVPCRYLHSPVSVASRSDIEAVRGLVFMFIERVNELL
jgi:endoglucanase